MNFPPSWIFQCPFYQLFASLLGQRRIYLQNYPHYTLTRPWHIKADVSTSWIWVNYFCIKSQNIFQQRWTFSWSTKNEAIWQSYRKIDRTKEANPAQGLYCKLLKLGLSNTSICGLNQSMRVKIWCKLTNHSDGNCDLFLLNALFKTESLYSVWNCQFRESFSRKFK